MAEQIYQEQIYRETPEIEAYKLGLLKEAQRLYNEQPLTLPAYEAAGLSQGQLQAANLARQGIGVYDPYFQAGSSAITQGQNLANVAAQGIAGIDMSEPYSRAQAGMESAMTTAQGAVRPDFGTAAGYLSQAGTRAAGATGAYNPNAVGAYMNPYQELVTQNLLKEFERQKDIQGQQLASQAVRAGAFGGTREGIQRAEMERNLSDVMAKQVAQDYAQNFGQAQAAAMSNYEAQQQRSLNAAQQLAGIGAQFGNQATSATQLGQSGAGMMSNISQGIGSLGQQQGMFDLQRGQQIGALGQSIAGMGVNQAGLGQAYAGQIGADVSLLSQIGGMEQANAQAQLDAMRSTQTQRALMPYQQLGFVSDIYKNAPSSQMALTTQSAPSASPWQQAVGTAVGVGTAAAGYKNLFGPSK